MRLLSSCSQQVSVNVALSPSFLPTQDKQPTGSLAGHLWSECCIPGTWKAGTTQALFYYCRITLSTNRGSESNAIVARFCSTPRAEGGLWAGLWLVLAVSPDLRSSREMPARAQTCPCGVWASLQHSGQVTSPVTEPQKSPASLTLFCSSWHQKAGPVSRGGNNRIHQPVGGRFGKSMWGRNAAVMSGKCNLPRYGSEVTPRSLGQGAGSS